MQEVIIALFCLFLGTLFCFYGYKAMRFLLPLWGLAAGYWVGGRLFQVFAGGNLLDRLEAVIVGVIIGLIFLIFSYIYYMVALAVFLGLLGYWIGSGLLIWAGVEPGAITLTAGLLTGIAFMYTGIYTVVHKYVLLLLTALGGASLCVIGLLIISNVVAIPVLKDGVVALIGNQSWLWLMIWFGLSASGYITQLIDSGKKKLSWFNEWEEA